MTDEDALSREIAAAYDDEITVDSEIFHDLVATEDSDDDRRAAGDCERSSPTPARSAVSPYLVPTQPSAPTSQTRYSIFSSRVRCSSRQQ